MTQPTNTNTDQPLAGLKVVEIGAAMAGPYCGLMLGDYGADVIKIEPVEGGDFARNWAPFFPGRVSHYFGAVNRNKKSLALDLKNPDGIKIAKKLLGEADILVANYRVGALDRMGLGYEALAEINPRLVYCNISGFGIHGPRATEPANDLFMQAYTGGMSLTGDADGAPCKMGISVADVGAGMFATIGILMAIEQRHRTGRGQRVDTSLLEGQISMLSYHFTRYFAAGEPLKRNGSCGSAGIPYEGFATADDDIIIATFNDKMWRNFCLAIGETGWADDAAYASLEGRIKHRPYLYARICQVLKEKPAQYWLKALASREVPSSRINRIEQVVDDEQVEACNMFIDVPGVAGGTMRMPGFPIKFAATGAMEIQPPPELGQHTHELLAGLGYDESERARLLAQNAVGAAK